MIHGEDIVIGWAFDNRLSFVILWEAESLNDRWPRKSSRGEIAEIQGYVSKEETT